jgi:hypothetical protein
MRASLYLASFVGVALAAPAGAQISATNMVAKVPAKSVGSNIVTAQVNSPMSMLVGGSDDCSTAAVGNPISGLGTFAVDTTLATTQTLQGAGCVNPQIDVWFYWTSTVSGPVTLSLCGATTTDTVIAVWNDGATPGACPTTTVGCNDDFCGLQSQLTFTAVSGTPYFLQLGAYGATTTYSATFTLSTPPPPSTNDSCTLPLVLVGNGPFAFDNTSSTTGSEGQTEGVCLAYGTTGVTNDLWFTWTALFSGAAQISLCGSTTDTRLAAYPGAGCPVAGTALGCNDDSCGLQSVICIPVTNGSTYTIQVGNYPGATGGVGTLLITPQSVPTGCQYDNGSTENGIGLTAGGSLMWMQRFGTIGQNATVASVSSAWGSLAFAGAPIDGTPVSVTVYEDPNDDGNPTDGVLVAQMAGVLTGGNTDVLQTIVLSSPVSVSGIYFVGAQVVHVAGEYPSPLDQDSCPSGSNGRAWIVGNTTGVMDFNNLGLNDVVPQDMDSIGFPGVWLLRADCSGAIAPTSFCFGDGTGTACPCGNAGAAGNGCASSVNANGANLGSSGSASIVGGTLTLLGTGMPNSSALYFQGTTQIGIVFGDGLRCAGGSVIRLGTKSNVAGASQYPAPGDLSVAAKGLVTTAGTRTYQVWYRNAAAFCTVSTFNLSNGLLVTWN